MHLAAARSGRQHGRQGQQVPQELLLAMVGMAAYPLSAWRPPLEGNAVLQKLDSLAQGPCTIECDEDILIVRELGGFDYDDGY